MGTWEKREGQIYLVFHQSVPFEFHNILERFAI